MSNNIHPAKIKEQKFYNRRNYALAKTVYHAVNIAYLRAAAVPSLKCFRHNGHFLHDKSNT
jgi:hypothetical protein